METYIFNKSNCDSYVECLRCQGCCCCIGANHGSQCELCINCIECKYYAPDGYDKEGYDQDGFGRNGFNRDRIYKYDENGFDIYGFDRDGINRYDENGFDIFEVEFEVDFEDEEFYDPYRLNKSNGEFLEMIKKYWTKKTLTAPAA